MLVNIVLFVMMGIDKHKAKLHKWRIPEITLLLTGFLGGFIGGLIGMHIFRHKTKKGYFHAVYIISAILHIYLLYTFLIK